MYSVKGLWTHGFSNSSTCQQNVKNMNVLDKWKALSNKKSICNNQQEN